MYCLSDSAEVIPPMIDSYDTYRAETDGEHNAEADHKTGPEALHIEFHDTIVRVSLKHSLYSVGGL